MKTCKFIQHIKRKEQLLSIVYTSKYDHILGKWILAVHRFLQFADLTLPPYFLENYLLLEYTESLAD